MQTPAAALADPALRRAEVISDRRGLPIAYTGRFAVVFRLRDPENGEPWALRCFTSPADGAARRARYDALSRHLAAVPAETSAAFVPFRYLPEGVRVGGAWYPALAMHWAEGETLGRFVERNRRDPAALVRLVVALDALRCRLEDAGIAHGDWQHDNLLVADGGRRVTLVDYDCVWVPELAGLPAPESGHPNYQHPRRGGAHGPGGDRFSYLLVQAGLLALAAEPSLWEAFAPDGESLLFKAADLADPAGSAAFRAARAAGAPYPPIAEAVAALERACRAEAENITRGDFAGSVAGRLDALDLPEPATVYAAAEWEKVPLPQAAAHEEAAEAVPAGEEATKADAIVAAARKRVARARRATNGLRRRQRHLFVVLHSGYALLAFAWCCLAPFGIGFAITAVGWASALWGAAGYAVWPRRRARRTFDRLLAEHVAVQEPVKGRLYRNRVALKRLNDDPANRSVVAFVAEALHRASVRDAAKGLELPARDLDRLLLSGILTMADLPPALSGPAAALPEALRERLYGYRQELVQSARAAYDSLDEERRGLRQGIAALERAAAGLRDAENELERYARGLGDAGPRRFLAELLGGQ